MISRFLDENGFFHDRESAARAPTVAPAYLFWFCLITILAVFVKYYIEIGPMMISICGCLNEFYGFGIIPENGEDA